jgi:D-serine deaminase-like pyridoxal phosphate-dependent protein
MQQDAYFQTLNRHLRQSGQGLAQIVVDLAGFKANLKHVKAQLPKSLTPRLAVKSLPSIELLKTAVDILQTEHFMLFHLPHLMDIFQHFPNAQVLFGKPMPIQALLHYAERVHQDEQIEWLIDTPQRLQQYLSFAQQQHRTLRINIEIDVGMHRGGVDHEAAFRQMLQLILAHPEHLQFSGLMGYDAHVAKLPAPFFSAQDLYLKSQRRYQDFIDICRAFFSDIDDLTLNGAGSLTLHHHCQKTVCNDVAFGSLLLKPSDFDVAALDALDSVFWIATPVLKRIDRIALPELSVVNAIARSSAVFVYGGYWRGRAVYPQGAKPHFLYGRSSNQELWQLPKNAQIDVDDYVFIQPAQSESIMSQFAQLWLYEDQQFSVVDTFRE